MKCFGIKITDEYYQDVKKISVHFKHHSLLDVSKRESHFHLLYTHYPNHFLLAGEPAWLIENKSTKKETWYHVNIREAEILERRHKARDQCMINGKYYDQFVLQKHAEQNKCQAPYHMDHKNVPICNTKAQMAAYKYDFLYLKGKYTPHPCRSMTHIDWLYREFYFPADLPGFPLAMEIAYPDQVKIIKQSKSVDVHVFIGSIGGYIGLFLGKTYNQSIILPLFYLKNSTRCNVQIIPNSTTYSLQVAPSFKYRICSYLCMGRSKK